MSKLAALAAGFIPSALLSKVGVTKLAGQIVRGEAPEAAIKAMELLVAVSSQPLLVQMAESEAKKKGIDIDAYCATYLPLIEGACGISTEGEWSARVKHACTHLLSLQQMDEKMTAVVICPYCDQAHGV